MGNFAIDLRAYAKKTGENLADLTQEVIIEIGSRVVMRSPVGDAALWVSPPPPGYVGGRFRANWQYGFGAIPEGNLPDIDPSGQGSISRITAGAVGHRLPGIHYVANNLPYAEKLENGYSSQAPAGMVGLTVIEFQNIVNDAVRK